MGRLAGGGQIIPPTAAGRHARKPPRNPHAPGGFDLAGQPVATGTLGFMHASRAATRDRDAIPGRTWVWTCSHSASESNCGAWAQAHQSGGGPASLLQHRRCLGQTMLLFTDCWRLMDGR